MEPSMPTENVDPRGEEALQEEKAAILKREVGRGLDQARAGHLSNRSVANIAAAVRERAERRT
jgi:antitoxin ParD1/3/4